MRGFSSVRALAIAETKFRADVISLRSLRAGTKNPDSGVTGRLENAQ